MSAVTARFVQGIAGLSPSNFGMVMATGIVSLAAQKLGMSLLANALFRVNVMLYVVLWILTVWRAVAHSRRFLNDMFDHRDGPGFFTVVAGTSLLAGQFVVLDDNLAVGTGLWLVAAGLWLVLTYAIFVGLTISGRKPSLDKGISGSWLLAVVATQSIAVITALLAPHAEPSQRLVMNFLALIAWLWGGMLYIWMISMIFYRYSFFPLSPEDLSPSYWINMGAMAISTLAGSLLLTHSSDAPFLASMTPFIAGFTLFFWTAGTWWIPMQLVLSLWRYVHRRSRLEYEPACWGVVFPLGMYAASTQQMMQALDLGFLELLPPAFLGISLLAWVLTAAGMVNKLLRGEPMHGH